MPASSGDPVTAALRISLASSSKDGSLEKRLVASAKRVLLTRIEYEPTENYQSKVLQDLKSKYILLNPQSNGLSVHSSNKLGEASNGITAMKAEPETLPSPKVVLFDPEHIQLGWRGSYPVGAGMINMGNTCYMNSTLQALFHVPALVNWLLSDSNHLAKCEQANGAVQECTICAMAKTLKASHQKSGSVIKPLLIYHKLKMICKHMVHGQQEDAHEFMRYLIESMEKAYLSRVKPLKLDSSSKETTPFNQIFGGYIRTEVMCLQCRSVSTTFQHFQDLLLDIRRVSTLDEAMSAYFCRERLEGDDAYRCERCQRKVSATKKFSIERPPHVLCIQLKRFSVMGGKIAKHVPFRQRLDLSRYLCQRSVATYEPLQYKLVAMVTHMGPSPNCGHYTAVAETSGGQFYQFDDGMVRPIPLSVALNTNAYIIIYEMERNDLRSGSYSASYPSSSKNLSQKPATITSASLVNGSSSSDGTIHKKPSSIPVPQPSTPRPGGSVLGLPPIRERERVSFGIQQAQPRLVMQIKNGKIYQNSHESSKLVNGASPVVRPSTHLGNQSTCATEVSGCSKASLVPYMDESSDSNSDTETTKTETESTNKLPPSGNVDNVTVKDANEGGKMDLSFEHVETDSAPHREVGQKQSNEVAKSNSSLLPAKENVEYKLSDAARVNSASSLAKVKATGKWQVTNSGCNSPSIHSDGSNNSVASSTTSWTVTEKAERDRETATKNSPWTVTPTKLQKSRAGKLLKSHSLENEGPVRRPKSSGLHLLSQDKSGKYASDTEVEERARCSRAVVKQPSQSSLINWKQSLLECHRLKHNPKERATSVDRFLFGNRDSPIKCLCPNQKPVGNLKPCAQQSICNSARRTNEGQASCDGEGDELSNDSGTKSQRKSDSVFEKASDLAENVREKFGPRINSSDTRCSNATSCCFAENENHEKSDILSECRAEAVSDNHETSTSSSCESDTKHQKRDGSRENVSHKLKKQKKTKSKEKLSKKPKKKKRQKEKKKEEFKKKQPGYNHSSSPSSVCSNVSHASSGQYEYQWVEKTHETIVREQKLEKMNGSAVSNGNHVDSVEPVLQNGLSGKENGWRDTYKHNGLNHEHDTPRNDSSGQTWNGNKEHWKTNGERERGTMWDGSRNSNNVNQLMKMSHRGYGNGTVTTWNGERSLVDREVEKDRRDERKRSYEDNYNEELDRGRVKKMRNKPLDQERPKSNPFQAYQNQKYNWNEHYYKNNHYYESNNYYNNKEHYHYQRGNKRYHPYPNFHKRKNNRFHNFGRDHWSKPKR